ncbi:MULTISPECIES: hypothetical protein [unclassified Streptomyces]|uniref:hypothetical protein n=1 Tax=unclassified Streptomyces TaxID=2593676 RepID=UPI002E8199BB|nr:hypothetical protein [Streptomyces sp. NBC_00589]WTI38488.1 hypothetical protein OIC96_27625 [Streptomyces sp. NBC_00775]WUB27833.1 hypothetical protein OHA51_22110 [Streptomyces sp. NBC_00589]
MTSSSLARGIRVAPLLLATMGTAASVAGCTAEARSTTQIEATAQGSPLLAKVARQIALPAKTWTASGTHTAKGYTTKAAQTVNVEGMKADCVNINLNKKLSADFRSDVFGPGMKGFFYKCQKVRPDTNQYWFTISSADRTQIDRLCDPATRYPIVHDGQHDAYWIDEPFTCTTRVGPS